MIQLLSRAEAFALNDTLAAYTVWAQEEFYSPLLPFRRLNPGGWWDFGGEHRQLTREECDRLNQEAYEEFLTWKEQGPDKPSPGNSGDTAFFGFPKGAIEDYPRTLGEGVLAFSKQLHWDAVLFLPDIPVTPWLEQDNDYLPVQNALQYLRDLGMDESFAGGVLANGEELATFVGHLFWLVRCNASLPIINFSGRGEKLIGSLCKYGNLHLTLFTPDQEWAIREWEEQIDLHKIEGRCAEEFSEDSRIDGRRLNV
jgi:hypothetical protein